MKMTTSKTVVLASLSAVLVIGAYIAIVGVPTKTNDMASSTDENTSTVTKTTYKNGTYEVSLDYKVPGSTNTLKASITIDNDVITKVVSTNTVTSEKSKEYTVPFDSNVSKEVVGKKLGSEKLSTLSGASLTTNAYNDVIESVIAKAQN